MVILDALSVDENGVSPDVRFLSPCLLKIILRSFRMLHNLYSSMTCECGMTSSDTCWISEHRVTSIILSRFILALRQNTSNVSTAGIASSYSTVDFAQRVEDGLGGSLSGAYESGIDADEDESEGPQHPEFMSRSFEGQDNSDNRHTDKWVSILYMAVYINSCFYVIQLHHLTLYKPDLRGSQRLRLASVHLIILVSLMGTNISILLCLHLCAEAWWTMVVNCVAAQWWPLIRKFIMYSW